MRTNVNLLKRVPEHNSPTFFVLHRTKCKPMHSEWECSQTINVLHKTVRERERERGRDRERESEREASERVCADSTVHPSCVYAKTTNAIYIYIYILPNYIYFAYI